ncbi:MAG: TAXI family TRAP transporter solute-binding subunit [Alphaproteobacteria bacterium]
MLRLLCLAAILTGGLASGPAATQDIRAYAFATGTTGGVYYPVGVAIEALVKALLRDRAGFELSVQPTAGSGANIDLLRDGSASLALVQGLHARQAASGVDLPDDPRAQPDSGAALRSIAMLWPDVMHVALREPLVQSGFVDDLSSVGAARLSFGRRDSGSRASTVAILTNLGIEPLALDPVDVGGYDAAVTAFVEGRIDGIVMFGGIPMPAMVRLANAAGADLRLLQFDEAEIARANGPFTDLWVPHVVPAGTYGLGADITTLAEPNALLVRSDMPEQDVYLITRAIFENLSFLGNMHPAARAIAPDTALRGMVFPLHPGALRYFDEIGLAVPDRLRTLP